MNYYNLDYQKYTYLLLENKEDNEIEFFWYCFKEYVNRLELNYSKYSKDIKYIINDNKKISIELNKLQKQNNINKITDIIKNYIFSTTMIIINLKLYSEHNLILTNINRWNKIKNNVSLINFESLKNQKEHTQIFSILKIIKIFSKINNTNLYNQLENYLSNMNYNFNNNYNIMIKIAKLAIVNKKYGLIKILKHNIDIIDLINNNIDDQPILNNNISINKLIDKYYNKINWKDI